MNEKLKGKIIAKMLKKGLCTEEEANAKSVSYDRLQMFIKGIELLEGSDTIRGQMTLRRQALNQLSINTDKKEVSKQKKVLKKLLSIPEDTKQLTLDFIEKEAINEEQLGGEHPLQYESMLPLVKKFDIDCNDQIKKEPIAIVHKGEAVFGGKEQGIKTFSTKFEGLDDKCVKGMRDKGFISEYNIGIEKPKDRHDAVKKHLKKFKSITVKEAADMYDVRRFSDHIFRLKKKGWDITKETVMEDDVLYGGKVKRYKYILHD